MNDKSFSKLINNILLPTQGMSTEKINQYLSMVATVAITALRGTAGDEFVNAYLQAALDDKSKPTITPMVKQ